MGVVFVVGRGALIADPVDSYASVSVYVSVRNCTFEEVCVYGTLNYVRQRVK